jgi:nicotinamide-nucleotide amidase
MQRKARLLASRCEESEIGMNEDLHAAAAIALDNCRKHKLKAATAESCTGGLVAGALTDIAGSSDVFERGFVTYSDEAKQQMLGVSAETLRDYGAVSKETAEEMARGAIAHSNADVAVAITGVAGPTGGTADKPVGLVHFAVASRNGALTHKEMRYGNLRRAQVRQKSVLEALAMLRQMAAGV